MALTRELHNSGESVLPTTQVLRGDFTQYNIHICKYMYRYICIQ